MNYSIKNNKILLICISLSLLFISSCSNLYFEDLAHIKRGMTIEEVVNVLENNEFDKGLELISSEIDEDIYDINNSNMRALIVEKEHPFEEIYYVMLFEDNKLEYWGENYHFVSHPDEKISSLSRQFSEILEEHYY